MVHCVEERLEVTLCWLACPSRGQSPPHWFSPSLGSGSTGLMSPPGSTLRAARGCLSPLRFGSLFTRACFSSPTRFSPTTMASADPSPPFGDEASPGNDTLLHCTAAAFTSVSIPYAFAVLCQLDALRRPSMRFLFIGSQFSPSLRCQHCFACWLSPLRSGSHGRSPFHSWLQIVVSSFSCSGISTGDLTPVYNVPMLGTHKALDINLIRG